MRIPLEEIEKILQILNDPTNVQRLAFDVMLVQLCEGEIVTLDRVQTNSLCSIVEMYTQSLVDEINDGLVQLPENRCTCHHEKFRSLQCMQEIGHQGYHAFTPKGRLSPATVKKFVKSLTAGEFKKCMKTERNYKYSLTFFFLYNIIGDIISMAGLDDKDVLKGYNNFKKMHKLVDNLAALAHCAKSERVQDLHRKIDNISDFHKANFIKHLGENMEHCCQCLSCGFHCNEDKIPCHL